MLLSAVFLHLGVDVLHEGVPLHQHVSERGAKKGPVKSETGIKVKKMNALLPGEDADNFGADRRQVCEVARENAVHGLLVHLSCGRKRSNAKMAKWRSSGREKAPSSTKRLLCGGEGKRALGPCEENNLLQSSYHLANTVADQDQRREARMPLLLRLPQTITLFLQVMTT